MFWCFGVFCAGDVQQMEKTEKITVKIFDSITLVHEAGMVLLEVSLFSDFKPLVISCII